MKEYFRAGLGPEYARIARDSLVTVIDIEKELDKLYQKTATNKEEASLFAYDEMQLEGPANKHALTAIIFSALAVEAYIYDYGARNISDSFMRKYIDKLDVVGKWVVVPQLVTGKQLPRGGRAFELLRRLVKTRNDLVHHKSSNITSMEEAVSIASNRKALIDEAKAAVLALDSLAEAIKSLDPEETPRIGLGTPNNEQFWIE